MALALIAAGCLSCGGDECSLGDSRCADQDTIESCTRDSELDEPPHWEARDCYEDAPICVTAPTGRGLCAVSEQPDPACPQETGSFAVCDQARIVHCEDWLAVRIEECAGTCFVSGESPWCSLLPEPDPLCQDDAACADEQTRIGCVDGWRTVETECNTAGGCVELDASGQGGDQVLHRAVCSLDTERDPMCAAGEYDAYCRTPTEGVTCWDGVVIQRFTCADQQTPSGDDPCFDHGNWVECLTPVVAHEGSEYGDGSSP